MAETLAYIVFCILTAGCGSQRRMGFFGTLIIALLVTPIPVLIVLMLTGPSHRHVTHWWHHWRSNRAPPQTD
jgi:hypothetical protein